MSRSRRAHAGFSLLEAVVAMVLISSAGLALFGWINGNIMALTRVHDANERSEATTNVLEYMHRVNPMLVPEGRAQLGTYSIEWRSKPIIGATEGIAYPRGRSLFQLALYSTAVSVRTVEGASWFDLQLKQVGYKKVRSSPDPG
jgi:general secretion pathway protein I